MPLPNLATHAALRAGASIVRLLPRAAISRAVGRLCEAQLPATVSRAIIAAFANAYRIDLSEVAPRERPYQSFDQFFTRPLRPGARPVDSAAGHVVSPSDGVLTAYGPIDQDCRITVKGRDYDVATLVGCADQARGLQGGQFAVIYLSPRNYHRVHTPAPAEVITIRSMQGDFFPVNAIGDQCGHGVLAANHRVAFTLQTKNSRPLVLVMVAALVVGKISVTPLDNTVLTHGEHNLDPAIPLDWGDELAMFH